MKQEALLENLSWEHVATGQLFNELLLAIRSRTGTWKHRPFMRGGNFITGRWATGTGARDDCQIASGTADHRDQAAIALYTLFYPKAPDQAFGLGLTSLWVPPGKGWGVQLSLHVGGKTVMGECLHLNFKKYNEQDGAPALKVLFGRSTSYSIFDTTVRVGDSRSHVEILQLWLSSAESMITYGLNSLFELELKVLNCLKDHEAMTSDVGPYLGDGIPPECTPRPLTSEEEEEARVLATSFFSVQRGLISDKGIALHALLLEALPFRSALGRQGQ